MTLYGRAPMPALLREFAAIEDLTSHPANWTGVGIPAAWPNLKVMYDALKESLLHPDDPAGLYEHPDDE